MTRARLPLALAALLLAGRAAGYQREPYPEPGKPLFWPLPAVPWVVNVTRPATSPGAPSCAPGAPDPALEAVRASFSAWRPQCGDRGLPDLDLVYAGTTDEIRTGLHGTADDLVVFRRGWCSNDPQVVNDPCYADPEVDCANVYGCYEDHGSLDRSAVAYTVILYDPRTGAIADADIEVNGWDGQALTPALPTRRGDPPPTNGWYFTCEDEVCTAPGDCLPLCTDAGQAGCRPVCTASGQTGCMPVCTSYGEAGCTYMDLRNTVTHEAGHFLGLAHTSDASTTMYTYTAPGELQKRTLSYDDIAGVCAIYPQPTGCSSGGGGGALAVALALAGLGALRRRVNP